MDPITDWPREAAANLSGGFTRTESIKMLIDKGCSTETAHEIVDQLLTESRNKGLKEFGLGLLLLAGAWAIYSFLDFGLSVDITKFVGIAGIAAVADGLRRLGSLWLVSKR